MNYDQNAAVGLYDSTADGDGEFTVVEGEDLIVLKRELDNWWKVSNSKAREVGVPASYVEVLLSFNPVSIRMLSRFLAAESICCGRCGPQGSC